MSVRSYCSFLLKAWLFGLIATLVFPHKLHAETVTLSANDFPPYNSPSLPNNGMLGAITSAAFAKMGDKVVISYRPWARALKEGKKGLTQGVIAVWHSPERANYLAFSHPIYTSKIGFYARTNFRPDVSNLSKLKNLRIGVVQDYANPPAFTAAQLQTDEVPDDTTNLVKLANGRVDLVLIDKDVANYIINHRLSALKDKLLWLEPTVSTVSVYNTFSKQSPGWEKRLANFNKGLALIQKDGTLAQIIQNSQR